MGGMTNPILFYPAAIILILFAFLTLKGKNIFTSLISAIVVFFIVGMFFYLLGSEYNAVVQIAIYGVAVPIILGLAIMFTNPKYENKENKEPIYRYLIVFFAGIFILSLIYLILTSCAITPDCFNISDKISINTKGVLLGLGEEIYIDYVLAFELVSIILTIVVAGLTMFNNKEGE